MVLPYQMTTEGAQKSKLRSTKTLPYGLLSIASYIKSKIGDKVKIQFLDCNLINKKDFLAVIKKKLKEFKPDVVGLSMMYGNSYKHLKDIAAAIKEHNKNTVVVLGGLAATLSYTATIKEQNNIDGICFYEGEIPFLKLIKSKNMLNFLKRDKSWITKESLKEGRIPQKSLVQNLDEVINLDYSLVKYSSYIGVETFSPFTRKTKPRRQFFIVTSRGCPFGCVFCIHSADKDKSMRYASINGVIKHVKFLISKYKMNILTMYDDQIFFNKKRAKKLFRALTQFDLKVECSSGLSPAFMDEELIRLMRDAGMDSASLAIESGSPYVLKQIIHKPLKLEMVKPVVDCLRKHGFWVNGWFVSGLPGETDKHRDETVKFIKEVGLDWCAFGLARPVVGSELYKICIKNGYIKKNMNIYDIDSLNKFIIKTPGYTPEYVTKKTYLMNLDVNFVNNYRMRNGEYRVATDIFRELIKRYRNHVFAYYYLAKTLHALNKKDKRIKLALSKAEKIMEKDAIWKEYFNYFGIDFMAERNKLLLDK